MSSTSDSASRSYGLGWGCFVSPSLVSSFLTFVRRRRYGPRPGSGGLYNPKRIPGNSNNFSLTRLPRWPQVSLQAVEDWISGFIRSFDPDTEPTTSRVQRPWWHRTARVACTNLDLSSAWSQEARRRSAAALGPGPRRTKACRKVIFRWAGVCVKKGGQTGGQSAGSVGLDFEPWLVSDEPNHSQPRRESHGP